MAASNEWQILYLTKTGWIAGGYKLDCGDKQDDVQPTGAVFRSYRKVTVGKLGAPSSMNVDEHQSNLVDDQELIASLLEKYGQPQHSV